ncbi:hypothetical protein Tco_0985900, partial [Tanacetum coccineum]
ERVATALAQHEANRANAAGADGPAGAGASGPAEAAGLAGGVAGGNVAPEVRGCTYKSFLNCNPYTFSGTKGVVRLSRWFEKLELVFQSNCVDENRVKFSTFTLQGRALTWWNGYVQTMGINSASLTAWTELKEMMTVEYH